jgi:predicted ATP-binding protein involved in virulence
VDYLKGIIEMKITIEGIEEYKGFTLAEPFSHEDGIIVLTGKNGSGKTRLLEGIRASKLSQEIKIDGVKINTNEIYFFKEDRLIADSSGLSQGESESQIRKEDLISVLNNYKDINQNPDFSNYDNKTPVKMLYNIGKKLGKEVIELRESDVSLHFKYINNNILGRNDFRRVCNEYIEKKKENKYNRYLAKEENEDCLFYSDDDFNKVFSVKPWIKMNEIIKKLFNDKFKFIEPDEESRVSYNPKLIEIKTNLEINNDMLSSGEKTIFWLVLTLFNCQYYTSAEITPPKIILLDEPDAFLHPSLVNKMFEVFDFITENYHTQIIITTHSPTTVALAPNNSIYTVFDNKINKVSKDEAISDLLDGVTQIAIDPDNRRQVYVESLYDCNIYQKIYEKIKHKSSLIDKSISLNFLSAGKKIANTTIIEKIEQYLSEYNINQNDRDKFIEAINGNGSCSEVKGQVKALLDENNKTVRGVIDWDTKNSSSNEIHVLGKGYCYSLENIVLDPICVSLLLNAEAPDNFSIKELCGQEIDLEDLVNDNELLQEMIDRYLKKVLNRPNAKDAEIKYINGDIFKTDKEYLIGQGHPLEDLVKDKFVKLQRFNNKGIETYLKYQLVVRVMIRLYKNRFVPIEFENLFARLQK